MGAIFVDRVMKCGRQEIESRLNNVIEYDFETRRDEEDMYRGDFGSSTIGRMLDEYKGKSESVMEKNRQKFLDRSLEETEKYKIDYAIIGQLGYVARTAKPEAHLGMKFRGEVSVGRGWNSKEYRNVTELKKALKSSVSLARELYGKSIYDHNGNEVGVISSESRAYKTKPQKLPAKYQWLDELVVVAYAGRNPY